MICIHQNLKLEKEVAKGKEIKWLFGYRYLKKKCDLKLLIFNLQIVGYFLYPVVIKISSNLPLHIKVMIKWRCFEIGSFTTKRRILWNQPLLQNVNIVLNWSKIWKASFYIHRSFYTKNQNEKCFLLKLHFCELLFYK